MYVAAYTFGRFFTEYERIDFAHKFGLLRLNDWVSVTCFLGGLAVLFYLNRPSRPHQGGDESKTDSRPTTPIPSQAEPAER